MVTLRCRQYRNWTYWRLFERCRDVSIAVAAAVDVATIKIKKGFCGYQNLFSREFDIAGW